MSKPVSYPFAITLDNLDDVLAWHHQTFGNARMEGEGGGGEDGGEGGAGGSGSGSGGDNGGSQTYPNGLGFPEDTPVAEMTEDERAAYNRHKREKNREETRRWKSVTGDRTPEQLQQDLADLEQYRQAEKTPAQQALEEAENRGRESATAESNTRAAKAILRAALEAQDHEQDDVDELVESIDVSRFIVDGDVDTTKLSSFAKRFAPAGKADDKRQRDFGAGHRREGAPARGTGGKAEATRRFGTKTGA